MILIEGIKEFEIESAVAVGYFDGMHPGHKLIIGKTVKAKDRGFVPAVLTFDFSKKRPGGKIGKDLFPKQEKYREMQALGIEICVECDFTMIENMTAEYFLHEVLIGRMRCKEIFCGEDFRFGHNRSTDAEMLKNMAKPEGVVVEVIPSLYLEDKIISTTGIKQFVEEGKVDEAARILGRNYGIYATITDIQNEKILGFLDGGLTLPKAGRYLSSIGREASPDKVAKIVVEDNQKNPKATVEISGDKTPKINEKIFISLFRYLGEL
ncbi:MAG: FAD synthetase family protein [Ruminococcaceae bacterium]|nr:FAD synthetase family protein [Oscillospiraceae bacterium]